MAKNQSRKPGRDVRGGKGANPRKGGPRSDRPGTSKGSSASGRGPQGRRRVPDDARNRRQDAFRGKGGRPGGRSGGGSSWIEGRRAVAEALEAGLPLRRALVAEGRGGDASLALLVSQLEAAGVQVEAVDRARLDSLSSHGAHQGVVVQAEPFAYAELSDIIAAAGSGDALVVVLDHVTDQGNLGAIVRSAEVVGAAGVVIAKARAANVGVGAFKTSAGAVMHVPIAQVPNLVTALEQLKEAGFWVGGATEHARHDVWGAPIAGRFCLVMGSEGSGISRLVREHCDFECRLPQRGRVESLNVAQAATVMCYEWLRRVSLESGTESPTSADADEVVVSMEERDAFENTGVSDGALGQGRASRTAPGASLGDSFMTDAAVDFDFDWDF